MATIKNLLIRIGVVDDNVKPGVNRVNQQLDKLATRVDKLKGVGKVGAFSALAGSAIQLGRAFAPATAALGHFAVAAAPAAGAVLALPAAIAVAGGAVATLKVGLSGLGDAFKALGKGDTKALDAALKKLAPSARDFVKSIAGAKEAFQPIRQAVQQRLFAGLGAQVRAVATNALPGLRVGMTDVATQFNGLGRAGLAAAKTPLFSGVLRATLGTTAAVLQSFIPAVWPLIQGLARLVKIGLPLVEVFGQWAGRMATAGAVALNSDRAATKFSNTIDKAIGVFRKNGDAATSWAKAMKQIHIVWGQLSAIGQNVFSIITAVGRAIQGSTAPSKSLLQMITDLTKRMADWANSAEGQSQLRDLFTSLQQVAANLVEILPQLGGVLTLILSLINSLPGPVRGVVLQMLAWSIVLSRLSGPISGVSKLVGGLSKAAKTFSKIGMGVGKGAGALGKGVGTFGAAAGRTVAAFGTAAGNIARNLAGVAANVGRAAASALVSLGRLAISSAITVARVVAGWVLMGVQSLIQAARMAAAWLIAMGPVGWIIIAVVALVALIIANWDRVKKWTVAIWNGLWTAIKQNVSAILAVAGWLGRIPGMVGGWFSSMAKRALDGVRSLLGYVKGIPKSIKNYFAGAGSWLWNAGKAIINGLVNGIKSAVGWLKSNLSWVTSLIPSWKGPMDVDQRLLKPNGAAIMGGLVSGITSQLPALQRTLAGVSGQIGSGVAVPMSPTAVASAASGQRPGATAAAGGGLVGRLKIDVTGADSAMKTMVKKWVRVDGGGDVQLAFGQS